MNLPTLPDEIRELVDAPFKEEEVISAIGSFPTGKAPGPDGLPIVV